MSFSIIDADLVLLKDASKHNNRGQYIVMLLALENGPDGCLTVFLRAVKAFILPAIYMIPK